MKIVVEDVLNLQKKFSGKYEYLEGGITKKDPSFHLDFGEGIIYFFPENIKELEKFIEDLEKMKEEISKEILNDKNK